MSAPSRPTHPPRSKGTLGEDSEIYHERPDIYEELARAEDADGLALALLAPLLRGLDVLDLGCGTGKYLELLSPHVRSIVGVDRAGPQLALARARTARLPNVALVHGDAADAPLPQAPFGAAIACWMLGTVQDPSKRMDIVERAGSLLIPGGRLLLLENARGGEFEHLRGRHDATRAHHEWLAMAGFSPGPELPARFLFPSVHDASRVIGEIWGPEAASLVRSACIDHPIATFHRFF